MRSPLGLAQYRREHGKGKFKIRIALLVISVHEQIRTCLNLGHSRKPAGEGVGARAATTQDSYRHSFFSKDFGMAAETTP